MPTKKAPTTRKQTPRSDTSAKRKFAKKETKECKSAKTGTYKGIEYESLEELSFLQWAFELKNLGYIRSIRRAESLLLCDAFVNSFVVQLKTKSTNGTQTLLHPHSYTAEFVLVWDYKKARNKFVWCTDEKTKHEKVFIGHRDEEDPSQCLTYIECKPSYDAHGMTRLFKVNQKFCWAVHRLFINLVKKEELFQATFTPKEFLITPSGKRRVLKWKMKTSADYLNETTHEKKRR